MGSGGKDAVNAAQRSADAQLSSYKREQREQAKVLEKQKQAYKDIEFTNPYADMENVFEDMTVNQQQAEFEAQQMQQQTANLMQGLKGAAGGSGIAGLAQAMANQGQIQSQRISASIGMQESQQQMAKAQGASQIQQLERQGEMMVQQAETARESTLLGMEFGQMQGIQAGVQAAYSNVQSAKAMELERINANKAMVGQIIGGVAAGAGAVAGGALVAASDKDLKKNIKKVGESKDGINIYEFEYRNPKKWGAGRYQGVMAEDLPKGVYKKAVSKDKDGIETVDYSKLDVEFKKV